MSVVPASWVESFATRLMQLRPGKAPLDAVRDATSVFEDSSYLNPEKAAEIYAQELPSGDEPGADRKS